MTQPPLARVLGAALLALASATSCESRLGTEAISIRPIYGLQDACTSVKISGHGFGRDVSATIGGKPVTDLALPEEGSLDDGFNFTAVAPVGDAVGYAEVVVSTGGVDYPLTVPFYYEACPATAYVFGVEPSTGLAAGTAVALSGCGLNASTLRVQIGEATPVELVGAACGTTEASFTAPDVAAGTWPVVFVDGNGAAVWPAEGDCPAMTADTGADSAGGDTANPTYCDVCPCVTYGGE